MKILVAEDNVMLLKTIELKLIKEGYEVFTTPDGRETMKEIIRLRPDMIIADVMMPYASGLEVVSMVRQQLKWKTPIIILSAMEQEEVILNAFDLGADDYITKPFSLNELVIRVKRLLNRNI
ncbi:MAG: response regulator transcription factor [Bacteroidota bacterium]|jgi:DNA-binding response OmpR family regulator